MNLEGVTATVFAVIYTKDKGDNLVAIVTSYEEAGKAIVKDIESQSTEFSDYETTEWKLNAVDGRL
jgi:hypothetical protein